MKKAISTLVFLMGIMFLSGCGNSQSQEGTEQLSALLAEDSVAIPARPAEIKGMIASLEGNKIVVKNEIGREILSEEERENKKETRKKMTQEERQAFRGQGIDIEVEDAAMEIPVGTMILKGSGDGKGGVVKVGFEDLQKGTYVSIWKTGENIEAIKIKGL